MKDKHGTDITIGAKVAIVGTVTGVGEIDGGQVHVTTDSGASLSVAPGDVTQKPALVIEAPEEHPGSGGVGVQKPKK